MRPVFRRCLGVAVLSSGGLLFAACMGNDPVPSPVAPPASATPPPVPLCEGTKACLSRCEAGEDAACVRFSDLVAHHRGLGGTLERALAAHDKACAAGSVDSCNLAAAIRLDGSKREENDASLAVLRKNCEAGSGDACMRLGYVFELGLGFPADPKQAVALYDDACMKGSFLGCSHLVSLSERGRNVLQADPAKAEATRKIIREKGEAACQGGDSSACLVTGEVLLVAHGGVQDAPRAVGLFQKGCELGDLTDCQRAATERTRNPVARDEASAAAAFQKVFASRNEGCELGSQQACNELANMYWDGHGTPQDRARSVELHQQACDKGHAPSCAWVADRFRIGDGIPKDMDKAASFEALACNKAKTSERSYCYRGGHFFEEGKLLKKDEAQAAALYKKGCELGDQNLACTALARMNIRGLGMPANPRAGVELYRNACEHLVWGACDTLARMFMNGDGVPADLQAASGLYKGACEHGYANACADQGAILERGGKELPADPAKAAEQYQRSCTLGSGVGCYFLGLSEEHPTEKGKKADLKRVYELFGKGCDHGDSRACERASQMAEAGKVGLKDPTRAHDFSLRACRMGGGEDCVQGKGKARELVAPDDKRLAELLTGDAESCSGIEWYSTNTRQFQGCMRAAYLSEQGLALDQGKLAPKDKDLPRATELYTLACEHGSALACGRQGYLLATGKKAQKSDKDAGITLLQRACLVHDTFACNKLRELHVKP